MSKNRILIIRFSSFGDIVQSTGVLSLLKHYLEAEIHWVTRLEFKSLLEINPYVDKVWGFDRKLGVMGLIKLGVKLRSMGFTHVYDAHSNLRSYLLSCSNCLS